MPGTRLLALLLAAPALGQSDLYYTEDVGPNHREWYGFAVASVGDADGDGFEDFVVGAPYSPEVSSAPGSASVHSGLNGLRLFRVQGSQVADRFGQAVAGAGDVDGDGHDDVIVGVPQYDAGMTDVGRVQVFSGFDGTVLLAVDGQSAGGQFGRQVAGGGDVDGDGTPDYLVAETFENRGRVFVVKGPVGPVIRVFEGAPGEYLGWTVADAGLVDGDGRADVLVGGAGVMRVYDGTTGAILREWTDASNGFGRRVAGGHDINGDGVPDVLTSDEQANANRGYVRAYSGATGGLLRQWDGAAPGYRLGASVAFGGDLDGNGVQDVVSGTTSGGAVRIFSGNQAYTVPTSLVSGEGAAVARLGDVTGDGLPELLIGGPETSFVCCSSQSYQGGRVLCTSFTGPGPGFAHCYGDGSLADCPCSVAAPVFREDFAAGVLPPGWTATGAWHVTGACNGALCGGNVMEGAFAYYGSSASCDFSNSPGLGSLTTPLIQLPDWPGGNLVAQFDQVHQQDAEVHRAYVHLLDVGGVTLRTWEFSGGSCGNPTVLDLNAFKGETVRLSWFFSNDGFGTWYLGWQVDDVTVRWAPNNTVAREGCRNSTGGGGMLFASGSGSVAADDLVLTAAQVPPGNNAIFFAGDTTFNPPFAIGNGLSCTGGSSFRYPAVNTGAGAVSLSQPVAGSLGLIQAGGTFSFQFWHRETAPGDVCAGGSNLTHAYSVVFGP